MFSILSLNDAEIIKNDAVKSLKSDLIDPLSISKESNRPSIVVKTTGVAVGCGVGYGGISPNVIHEPLLLSNTSHLPSLDDVYVLKSVLTLTLSVSKELTLPFNEDVVNSIDSNLESADDVCWLKSERIDPVSDSIAPNLLFDSNTYVANALSFSVSTLLIKSTISLNESLSASDENKIESILPLSISISELREPVVISIELSLPSIVCMSVSILEVVISIEFNLPFTTPKSVSILAVAFSNASNLPFCSVLT